MCFFLWKGANRWPHILGTCQGLAAPVPATETMTSFRYSPLEHSQFRILTLLPGNFDDPLTGSLSHRQFLPANKKVPKYEALSYVWGDQIYTDSIALFQDDHPKDRLIGPYLATALRHLRQRDQSRELWIDALCINQDDTVERADQVRRMGEIYREAGRVVVWLGPEEDNSSVALSILDHIGANVYFDPAKYEVSPLPRSDQKFGNPPSVLSYSEGEWLAIKKLFARSWFTRLWVRQEIVLAKPSAVVVAGFSTTTWSRFGQAAGCIEVKIALGATNGPFSTRFVSDLSNIVALFRTTLFKHPVALLNFTRSCRCKDDRDRVYSLMGLMDPCYAIQPDYSQSATDVSKEFMLHTLKVDTRLDILAFCDITASPSWVPNLPGRNPANHFWRNFATGYYEAHFKLMQHGKIEVAAIRCGVVSKMIGHIARWSTDVEVKQWVKSLIIRQLGRDTRQWEEKETRKLAQTLLGGHWYENTNHRNDPPLVEAISVLKNWVIEDIAGTNDSNAFMDLLVDWAVLYSLSGWSVYQTTSGHFGICSSMCLPGDQIYALLGCKDPIVLRKPKGFRYYRVVGPTYIYDFSLGQAVLGNHMPSSSFVNSFENPRLGYQSGDGLGMKDSTGIQHIDRPYNKIEDDHPLWYRRRIPSSTTQTDPDLHLFELRKRGIDLEKIILG